MMLSRYVMPPTWLMLGLGLGLGLGLWLGFQLGLGFGLEWMPPTLNASMFSRHPLAERSRAASLPLTRLERTEPQMKRSSRATPGRRG